MSSLTRATHCALSLTQKPGAVTALAPITQLVVCNTICTSMGHKSCCLKHNCAGRLLSYARVSTCNAQEVERPVLPAFAAEAVSSLAVPRSACAIAKTAVAGSYPSVSCGHPWGEPMAKNKIYRQFSTLPLTSRSPRHTFAMEYNVKMLDKHESNAYAQTLITECSMHHACIHVPPR